MFFTIGKRITAGFAVMLIIIGVITIMSYTKIGSLASLSGLAQNAIETDKFLIQKEVDHLNWLKMVSESRINYTKAEVQMDPAKCGFGKWLYKALDEKTLPDSVLSAMKDIEPTHKELHESAKEMNDHFVDFDRTLEKQLDGIWIAHLDWMTEMGDSLLRGHQFHGQLDHTKCGFGKWYKTFESDDPKLKSLIDSWLSPHKALHDSGKIIVNHITDGDSEGAREAFSSKTVKAFEEIKKSHKKTEEYLNHLHEKKSHGDHIYRTKSVPAVEKMGEKFDHLREVFDKVLIAQAGEAAKDIAGTAAFSQMFMLIFGIIALVVGIFLSVIIARSIIGPITRISSGLNSIAGNVAAASTELSDASQELSSMSSEQASSVEETSSSLEEIEGMVENNVGNAEESAKLSEEVRDLSEEGNESMEKLTVAMDDILESNKQIEDLVRLIGDIGEKTKLMDEIVFQTKLLSFNASVEAERAGEHGRGFAVVAQEVGNLAQMSGKSAKEIADIVTSSIKETERIVTENKAKVENGSKLVADTAESLKSIQQNSSTVASGSTQVLDASKDQAKGIKQINVAMVQIDKATQETAATAEETASSSEELTAQADSLKNSVDELTMLVTGKRESHQASTQFRKERGVSKSSKKVARSTSSNLDQDDSGDDGWENL